MADPYCNIAHTIYIKAENHMGIPSAQCAQCVCVQLQSLQLLLLSFERCMECVHSRPALYVRSPPNDMRETELAKRFAGRGRAVIYVR